MSQRKMIKSLSRNSNLSSRQVMQFLNLSGRQSNALGGTYGDPLPIAHWVTTNASAARDRHELAARFVADFESGRIRTVSGHPMVALLDGSTARALLELAVTEFCPRLPAGAALPRTATDRIVGGGIQTAGTLTAPPHFDLPAVGSIDQAHLADAGFAPFRDQVLELAQQRDVMEKALPMVRVFMPSLAELPDALLVPIARAAAFGYAIGMVEAGLEGLAEDRISADGWQALLVGAMTVVVETEIPQVWTLARATHWAGRTGTDLVGLSQHLQAA